MSDKARSSFCIVIDSSIARAAGAVGSTHPTGSLCREFLMAVRGVGHRIAWNRPLRTEWDAQQSTFARTWFVSMMRIGKVRAAADDEHPALREAIRSHSSDAAVTALMLKDAHLIEAALATDRRVASLDETVRGHFGRLAATVEPMRTVMWINPVKVEDGDMDWLRSGALEDVGRHLARCS